MIQVDKHGYVRLVDSMGSDLEVVNDARVSHEKETSEMRPEDIKLLQWIGREEHESPFRSQVLKFEIRAPLMVARQWFKYKVASQHVDEIEGWNESSRRYVTDPPDFFVPEVWRSAPASRKQGSGPPMGEVSSAELSSRLAHHQAAGRALYELAMEHGVCAEQARLFLPAYGLYVRWRWTASLQSVSHFCRQRLADDAQKEIRDYAVVVADLAKARFPLAWEQMLQWGA